MFAGVLTTSLYSVLLLSWSSCHADDAHWYQWCSLILLMLIDAHWYQSKKQMLRFEVWIMEVSGSSGITSEIWKNVIRNQQRIICFSHKCHHQRAGCSSGMKWLHVYQSPTFSSMLFCFFWRNCFLILY